MKNSICILEEWNDDDGLISFNKPRLFNSYEIAKHTAYERMMEFVKNDPMCCGLVFDIPTEDRFCEILIKEGYVYVMTEEGSSDFRKYFRIIELEQETRIAEAKIISKF